MIFCGCVKGVAMGEEREVTASGAFCPLSLVLDFFMILCGCVKGVEDPVSQYTDRAF